MKKMLVVLVGLAVCATFAAAQAPAASAVKVAAPATQTVVGTVVAKSDAAGIVTSVAIQVDENKTVNVVLDEQGKKLAGMKGKKVEVVGVMVGEALQVKEFKELPAENK